MKIETPEMEGYEPPKLNGWFEFEVRDAVEGKKGNGFMLYLTVINGPEDQAWDGEEVMHWVHTDLDANEKWQIRQRMDGLYNTCAAFGVKNAASFNLETFVGKVGRGLVITRPDKDGVMRTNVTSWKIAN